MKAIKRGRVLDDVDALAGLSKKLENFSEDCALETQSAQGTDANTSNNHTFFLLGSFLLGQRRSISRST